MCEFRLSKTISANKIDKVREINEMLWVEKLAQTSWIMKLRNGGPESVPVIGFNPEAGVGGHYKMMDEW